jgi:thiol-disulfide isomerase/thioredoxin
MLHEKRLKDYLKELNMVIEITMDDLKVALPEPDDIMRVVMFYGATCGPCKRTMPNYETVAQYFTLKNSPIAFYRINAWEPIEQKEYCEQVWNIDGVPHFKVFLHGYEILTKQGGGDETVMFKFLQDAVDEAFKQRGVKI